MIAALAELGTSDVVIAGRRPESTAAAVELAGRLDLPIRAIGWDLSAVGDAADAADLVVSTVPAGAPDAFADRLKAVPALFDVVYYPWPTRLAAAGRARPGDAHRAGHVAASGVSPVRADHRGAGTG